jgi:hypothetical protein
MGPAQVQAATVAVECPSLASSAQQLRIGYEDIVDAVNHPLASCGMALRATLCCAVEIAADQFADQTYECTAAEDHYSDNRIV